VFENFHHGFSAFGRTRMDFEPFRLLAGGWGSTPAVNMVEKDTAYELTAELPGMDDSNVELKVAGGVLTIKGEKKEVTEEKSGEYAVPPLRKNHFLAQIRTAGRAIAPLLEHCTSLSPMSVGAAFAPQNAEIAISSAAQPSGHPPDPQSIRRILLLEDGS
jgi:hypothetical protein